MNQLNQIKWRCRRGVLELDLILHRFYEKGFPSLNDDDKALFSALLNLQDPVLISWLIKRNSADKKYQALVKKILSDEYL